MADRAVGPIRDSLGVKFLNRNLEITVENYKVERLLELLNSAWLGNINSFQGMALWGEPPKRGPILGRS